NVTHLLVIEIRDVLGDEPSIVQVFPKEFCVEVCRIKVHALNNIAEKLLLEFLITIDKDIPETMEDGRVRLRCGDGPRFVLNDITLIGKTFFDTFHVASFNDCLMLVVEFGVLGKCDGTNMRIRRGLQCNQSSSTCLWMDQTLS